MGATPDSFLDGATPGVVETIGRCLDERGWCCTPDFVPPLLVSQLAAEVRAAWASGQFRHAGVGRGGDFEIRPEIRSDRVFWLRDENSGAVGNYFGRLEALRQAINREMWLGLFEFEGHFAVYPPGTCYRKHLDQFRGIGERTVTAILYLNQDWGADDGGELRLYVDPDDETSFLDIQPLGGQLVTFLSARFMHEVLPAQRERLSITGWFKRRSLGSG